ncbi:1489_t:CDS:2, partial [Racocetra persica]
AQSTSSVDSSNLSTSRANATFTRHFYQDDETDNTIIYCKLCTQELEDLDASPYPYSKSGKSTGYLIQHLRDKHHITSKNYRQYLDDDEQPMAVAVINQDLESMDTDLPSLSSKQQRELTKLV